MHNLNELSKYIEWKKLDTKQYVFYYCNAMLTIRTLTKKMTRCFLDYQGISRFLKITQKNTIFLIIE